MTSVKLQVHSIIDIITNSSTEIFVSTTENTVDAVYDLLKLILTTSNSPHHVRDAFNVYNVEADYYESEVTYIGVDILIDMPMYHDAVQAIINLLGSVHAVEVDC